MNKRKLLCLLLCVVMVAGLAVPGTLAIGSATTGSIKVTQDGESVSSVAIPQNGNTILTASGTGSYQWQILAGDTWVNIQGETGAEIWLTYAMVASLMPTSVRCAGDGAASKAVEVTVADTPESQPMAAAHTYTVLKEATEIGTAEETVDIEALMEQIIVAEAEVEEKDTALTEAREAEAAAQTAYDTAKANADALAPQPDVQVEPAVTDGPSADDGASEASSEAPADNSAYEDAVGKADKARADLDAATADREAAEAAYNAACDKRDALNGQAQAIMAGVSTYAEGDGPSAPEQVVIQIDYLMRKDKTKVADSYVIRISKGSSFSRTIQSPVIVGYKADQTEVSLDLQNVQEGQNIEVFYEPDVVSYKVEHWQQNADNDDYTLVRTDDKTGYTEAAVGKGLEMSEAERPGFVNQWYDDTTTIAADGTTTIKIKYDRQYYLMKFDMDGGYGTEPIYARYGASIARPTAPTRAGYTFDGWEPQVPSTMPLYGGTYKAKWIAGDSAKVTVVFWGENANDEGYSYIKSTEIEAKPGTQIDYESVNIKCGQTAHMHNESCYTCGSVQHQHNNSCYGDVASSSTTIWGAGRNPSQGQIYYSNYYEAYYIYLNGSWYQYNTPGVKDGDIVSRKCGLSEHTHNSNCLGCGQTEHKHSDSCYVNKDFDPNLWQYVKSDTVTVAADGSTVLNVYYDRTEFTLHFRKANSNRDDYGTITAKWGAAIGDQFAAKNNQAGVSSWSEKSNGSPPWTSYWDIMPAENRTYYAHSTSGKDNIATYYTEDLNGQYQVAFTVNSKSNSGFTVTVNEDFPDLQGFTKNFDKSSKDGANFNDAKFYYDRNSYKLEYMSSGTKLEDKTASVKYEAPLTPHNITPPYPDNLEPNAYIFGGWHDDQYFQQPVNWNSTMPASDKVVYAKWVPVSHTVNFYTSDNMTTQHAGPYTVPHGEILSETVEAPTNGAMFFVGWFYMDGDTEKAFDPDNMPIVKDLNLYAKWSATKPMPYTVYYKVQGTDTDVAAPTNGAALVESTKTLEAKTGTELYADYRAGYYPVVGSHNIKMDSTQEKIEYTFWYVEMPEVYYKVQYLEKDTNKVLKTEVIKSTHDAVITENYVYVDGYTPLEVSQRLILAAEDEDHIKENVLIFYYEKDLVNVSAQVNHWLMDPETGEYTILKSTLGIPKVKKNSTYTENYLNPIPTGYKFNHAEAVDTTDAHGKIAEVTTGETGVSLTVPEKGFILNLYYECEKYPYVFHFVNEETNEKIANDVTGTENYGKLIQYTAPTSIDCYDLVDNANHSFYIDSDSTKNEHTFYYREKQIVINYVAVGPDGVTDFGSVSPETETVKAKSDDAQGSTATASGNTYRFAGWYSDPDCTTKISDNAQYVPEKVNGMNVAATYYAKFEYNLTSMTITKSGTAYDGSDTFIFDIFDKDNKKVTTVTLRMGGSITISGLTVGETYTVSERVTGTRYTATNNNQSITLAPTGNTVTINNSVNNNKWLTSSKTESNVFNGKN